MISLSEIAWLAGLLEGEGCFTFSKGPDVVLKMTDKDVVERAASLMGAKVIARDPKNIKWKRTYCASIHGYQAIAWMLTIYPFMGERRKEKIIENIGQMEKDKAATKGTEGWTLSKSIRNVPPRSFGALWDELLPMPQPRKR